MRISLFGTFRVDGDMHGCTDQVKTPMLMIANNSFRSIIIAEKNDYNP